MGDANKLHTKSSYADFNFSFPKPKTKTTIKADIASLKQKEAAFYSSFFPGCKTYESFIKKLRELFKEVENDKKVFKAFENANIVKEFEDANFEIGVDLPEQIIITFIKNTPKEITVKDLGGQGVTIEGDKIIIDANLSDAKRVFNKLFSQHFKVLGRNKRNFSNFLEKLKNDSQITNAFQDSIQITNIQGSIGNAAERIKTEDVFSYTKEDINKAQNDSELKKQIEEALKKVKNFILNIGDKYSCSPELKDAINYTWKHSFSSEQARQAFFEKGGYVNYLKGAFGEFRVALMVNYLAIKTNKTHLAQSLISDTIKKEQDKSDVSLLRSIGADVRTFDINAQVKNINIFSTDKIEGNIHLSNFKQSVNTTSFEGFLANYFFNIDYQNQHQTAFYILENCLEDYFAEIMNLAISDSLDDKVTFYFIGGALVPGSRILSDEFVKSYVEITSNYKGLSNEQYMSSSRPRGLENQPFLKWWKPQKGGNHIFKPTEINDVSELFSHISIRTSFFHGGKEGLGSYMIF